MRLILSWNGRRITAAEVRGRRPLAARVLLGQPVARVLDLVPRLFSLCGQAQGIAARLACGAARGEVPDADVLQVDGRRIALEAIGEHLWRLLLDWPPLLGQPVRKDDFLAWRKRLLAVTDAAQGAELGAELRTWLNTEPPLPIEPGVALTPGALLPMLAAEVWGRQAFDEGFAEQPTFAGLPAETGSLARHFAADEVAGLHAAGQGVAARLAARYADLHFLAAALREPEKLAGWLDTVPLAGNVGLARVETARGLLLHLTQVKDGRVGRYVIVAPTEWNFHPQGAFVSEITACPAATQAEAEALAHRLALSLDPCVAYQIEVKRVADDA